MHPVIKWLARIGAVVAVGAVVVLLGYKALYDDWPWNGPDRLALCDGHYDRASGKAKSRRALNTAKLYPVYRVPPFVGERVYSAGPGARQGRGAPPCGAAVYMRSENRRYTVFKLAAND
jgi:hypothetical protein